MVSETRYYLGCCFSKLGNHAFLSPLQPVVPSCLLAVVIGLCGSYKLHQLGTAVTGSLSYAITFALYALMITSGLVLHCLLLVECGQAPVTQASYTHTDTQIHTHTPTHTGLY